MAGSLKDQLLKAGLVSTKQVKKAAHEKRKGQGGAAPDSGAAQRAQAEKAERDRELNRKRQEDTERKANAAAIKQLIEANRLDKGAGEIPYNFTDGSRISRIYVTPEIHAQLIKGALCLARLGPRYELVRPDVAEKISARDPARVIMPAAAEPEAPAADDPYAAYQVPDDLIW
jgi:hypothetical protein